MKKIILTLLFLGGLAFLSCSNVVAMNEIEFKEESSSFSSLLGKYIKRKVWTTNTKVAMGFGFGFAGTYVLGEVVSRKVKRFVGLYRVGLIQGLFGGVVVGSVVRFMGKPNQFEIMKKKVHKIDVTTKDTNEEVKKLKESTEEGFKNTEENFKCMNSGLQFVDTKVGNSFVVLSGVDNKLDRFATKTGVDLTDVKSVNEKTLVVVKKNSEMLKDLTGANHQIIGNQRSMLENQNSMFSKVGEITSEQNALLKKYI